jgi:elongation factor Ts
MANYTAADVKRLREQTGAGMMDCKNALVDANGDFDAAVEALRLKGVKDAGKRAQRTAANGLVTARLDGTSAGVLVELNCETDFVAKTDLFQQVAGVIADAALAAGPTAAADRLAVLGLEVRPGQTTQELIEEAGSSLKEKLELGRYARFDGGYVTRYLHKSSPDLPPTLGVLVQLASGGEDIGQDIAHQVAAMRPQYVTTDSVPEDVVANERRIAEQLTREEGKPEQAIPKIVEGRVGAFLKEIVLVEQASVRDQKKSVKQLLAERGAAVTGFARFQIGQAG